MILFQVIYSSYVHWNGSICFMNQVPEIYFAINTVSSSLGLWVKKEIIHSDRFLFLCQSVLHSEF